MTNDSCSSHSHIENRPLPLEITILLFIHLQKKLASFPRTISICLLLFTFDSYVGAQSNNIKPANLAAGAPTGAYKLSGFDNINLFNGNLNFSLPLMQVGGRGNAQFPINLNINSIRWRLEREVFGGTQIQTGGIAQITWGSEFTSSVTVPVTPMWYADTEIFSAAIGVHALIDYSPVFDMGGGAPIGTRYFIDPNDIQKVNTGYGPGVLQARTSGIGRGVLAGGGHVPGQMVTRLAFTAPDGTEYELRDAQSGGVPNSGSYNPVSRGTIFISSDGSGAIFVSDAAITETYPLTGESTHYPSGNLTFSDGTRYRIVNGLVEWMRDRNGNTIVFTYGTNQDNTAEFRQVRTIVDSLGRLVTIDYKIQDQTTGKSYDRIKYYVTETETRELKVWRGLLSEALSQGETIKTFGMLFGAYELDTANAATTYNPDNIVSKVDLPDGRSYQIRYNAFNEIAEVILPTGGKIKYEYVNAYSPVHVQRRVAKRCVYENNTDFTPELKQSYDAQIGGSLYDGFQTIVTVQQKRGSDDGPLSFEKHYFHGHTLTSNYGLYSPWKDGQEFKTESFTTNGSTPLRRINQEWEVPSNSWCTASNPANCPPINPRIKSTATELLDTGASPKLVAKQIYGYDDSNPTFRRFNNRTDVWEYAYIEGDPTPTQLQQSLLRHTQTSYLSSNIGAQEYNDRNIIQLPSATRVFGVVNGQEQLQARTEFIYDETSLLARSSITGWTDPGSLKRGNLTTSKKWINPTNDNAYTKALAKYDVLGNVIETTDANNAGATNPKVTTTSYTDCFGSADGNVRSCTSPTLLTQYTYALPTSVTNTLGQIEYMKYDYYSGLPVTTEDANGMKTNMFYNDNLNRITQIISFIGTPFQTQTSFTYHDTLHKISTKRDLNTFGDNKVKYDVLYDGLGRTTETHSYESSSSFITIKKFYDGLGRIIKATNPYRTTGDSTYGEVETTYDALGRVTNVTNTPDNSEVITTYFGDAVTVTDQDGNQLKRFTDALGRLTSVIEAPNVAGYGYETNYRYDALDNLTMVIQGPQDSTSDQLRSFSYDGLSRITSATNPESGTISYAYDGNCNLIERTDPRYLAGTSTHIKSDYYYDALNRVTRKSYNDGTPEVNYLYDEQVLPSGAPVLTRGASIGQLLAVVYGGTNSINGTYYGYDNIGRAIKSAQVTNGQSFPTMEYRYNLAGNMTWQKYPSGREVTTEYDDVGRLSSIGGVRAGETAKTYASLPAFGAHGQITAMKLGNGLWERTFFNRRLQPTEIRLGTESNQESVLKLTYSYGTSNNNGNVKSQTITIPTIGNATGFNATQSYEYDPLNRLKSAQEMSGSTSNWKQTYTYDRFGNRRFSYTNGATTIPAEPTTPQSIALNNPEINPANNNRLVGYDYDLAGNVIRDAQNRSFAYDAENHQVAYNGGATINSGDTASYNYDGESRRVKKQVGGSMVSTVFVYNILGQLVSEYVDSQQAHPKQTCYVTTDTLGSTRVVTGQDQQVKERHDYLPFGEELVASATIRSSTQGYDQTSNLSNKIRHKFTGKERDNDVGLDYFGARYYASTLGRFSSTDPLGGTIRAVNPQSINRYAYALNNPLRYIDPHGLAETTPWDQLNSAEQMAIGPKLKLQTGESQRDAFNRIIQAGASDATRVAASVQSVRIFIAQAGGLNNSQVWQQIIELVQVNSNGGYPEGATVGEIIGNAIDSNKNQVSGIQIRVDNKDKFLNALRNDPKNTFKVDSLGDRLLKKIGASWHPFNNARARTNYRTDPQMHYSNDYSDKPDYGPNYFFVHWDHTSSYGKDSTFIGDARGGLAHGPSAMVGHAIEYLKRTEQMPK